MVERVECATRDDSDFFCRSTAKNEVRDVERAHEEVLEPPPGDRHDRVAAL